MGLINGLFSYRKSFVNPSVQITLEELERFQRETLYSPGIGEEEYSLVKSLIRQTEKTEYSIVNNKMHPRHLVFILLQNALSYKLCSGDYHIYKGYLSVAGDMYLQSYLYISNLMVKEGFISKEEEKADLDELFAEISRLPGSFSIHR